MLFVGPTEADLDDHEEMVVEHVTIACYEQEPMLDPDDIDEYIENLRDRL